MDDTRVYNKANELQTRDVDTDSNIDYTLTHDAVGNLTDDGENNEYIYDAWGRLRFVNNQSQDPVSEYRYNGLNWRIAVSHDTDADDDIDASDIIWYFVHDERWRIVAVYREADANPKEQFDYHAAGQNGLGTASYIDDVILRDKDNSDDWEEAADDTLEERLYYCQNWRHDVVALIDASGGGTQVEHQRYEAYGVPYLFVAGDVTANGTINATDTNQIQTWIDAPSYDVRGDLDLDNDVDATDKSLATANSGKGGGREKLSTHSGNRKGYAGYEFDDSITHMSYHVRHRVLNSTLGQWQQRDSLGYVDGSILYGYVQSNPVTLIDPLGRVSVELIQLPSTFVGEGGTHWNRAYAVRCCRDSYPDPSPEFDACIAGTMTSSPPAGGIFTEDCVGRCTELYPGSTGNPDRERRTACVIGCRAYVFRECGEPTPPEPEPIPEDEPPLQRAARLVVCVLLCVLGCGGNISCVGYCSAFCILYLR